MKTITAKMKMNTKTKMSTKTTNHVKSEENGYGKAEV